MKKYDAEKLLKYCSDVCMSYGLSKEAGDAVADVLVRTDMLGIFTHGVFSLKRYMEKFAAGGLNVNGVPEVVAEGPAWAIVDGHDAIGMYPAKFGLDVAVRKAKESGIAYVGVKNSSHSGAPGILAAEGAEQGMLTISVSNCPKNSTIPGTKGETFGNNPISFAAPCKGRKHPIFMDISCSTVAGTKIRRKQEAGEKEIPAGWAVDEDGLPCTDASKKLFMTFFAGHKGYCLALLVEILSAVLSGGALINESTLWLIPENVPLTSQAFIVIDPKVMLGEGVFEERMAATADEIVNSPKAEGTTRIFLPGDMEWERYDKAVADGIEMPDDVSKVLEELAELTGLDLAACRK